MLMILPLLAGTLFIRMKLLKIPNWLFSQKESQDLLK